MNVLAILANGGGDTPATTVVDNIIAQITPVINMMISIMTSLLGNVFFAFLFACGFVRIGMSLIKKAKKTSK